MVRKLIILASGNIEGLEWDLRLAIIPRSKRFSGYFFMYDQLRRDRKKQRNVDRSFFVRRLGKEYMRNKVVHHQWNEDILWTFVLDKDRHVSGGLGRKGRKGSDWKEKEEWLFLEVK
jgi:hypothetical protein